MARKVHVGGYPEWAYGVRHLVVLSGAGISTDSGIPDFRGPSGAWTLNPGVQNKHTYRAFLADPELRGSYWKSRYERPIWRAEPNAGHLAVAALANSDVDTTVVTQNTDGLHQQAGTPADRVIERGRRRGPSGASGRDPARRQGWPGGCAHSHAVARPHPRRARDCGYA